MNEINVLLKKEIPEYMCNWSFTRCSKCGFENNNIENITTVCEDTNSSVEKIFTQSKIIKSWDDVLVKCHMVLCLNSIEYKSGMEPDDVVIEESQDYHLLEEEKHRDSLLLIVIHDGTGGNIIEEEKQLHRVLVAGKIKTIDELSKDTKVCSNAVCSECTECTH